MKYCTIIMLCVSLFTLSCASLTAPIKRTVDGNTFHSERFPAIHVKVNDELPFDSYEQEKEKPEDEFGAVGSRNVTVDNYSFVNENAGRILLIKIQFMLEKNWSFLDPNYGIQDGVFIHGDEIIAGTSFSTGVFPIRDLPGIVLLSKVWGRAAGDTTLFEIVYSETVGRSWPSGTELNATQEKILQDFLERASKSFEVVPE